MMNSARKVVLSDRYQIGEELGRGAYGQVFKGIDLINNLPVAIKQISLAGMSAENLQGVQGEIELLKTLNHANIVKYIGSFKTRTHLYIILEFMESGALSAMIKPGRMGVFPEHLVAVYITQVLQGLQYLHEQGVVHRDIKGANILTHKVRAGPHAPAPGAATHKQRCSASDPAREESPVPCCVCRVCAEPGQASRLRRCSAAGRTRGQARRVASARRGHTVLDGTRGA